jgi:hypothetical protein
MSHHIATTLCGATIFEGLSPYFSSQAYSYFVDHHLLQILNFYNSVLRKFLIVIVQFDLSAIRTSASPSDEFKFLK